jgi:predicted transcriptional regulator of viral defense system
MTNLRSAEHNSVLKTVGRQTARLLTALYDRSQTTFTLADAEKITGLSSTIASSLLHKAARRGLVSRLKPGVFVVVPAELGSGGEYAGNPYLTAVKLTGEAPCFISHASAMEIHRMVTQPQLVIFTSSSKRIRSRKLHGTEFRFVFVRPKQYFGTVKHWVTKPEYCGGLTEVAKGLWMRREGIQTEKIVDYALRLRVGAVCRRLGYLLELYAIGAENDLRRLRRSLTATYAPLDPMLAKEGPHLGRWRLQLNITPQELKAVRST